MGVLENEQQKEVDLEGDKDSTLEAIVMIKVRNPEDLNDMEKRGQICDVNTYMKDVMAD